MKKRGENDHIKNDRTRHSDGKNFYVFQKNTGFDKYNKIKHKVVFAFAYIFSFIVIFALRCLRICVYVSFCVYVFFSSSPVSLSEWL